MDMIINFMHCMNKMVSIFSFFYLRIFSYTNLEGVILKILKYKLIMMKTREWSNGAKNVIQHEILQGYSIYIFKVLFGGS